MAYILQESITQSDQSGFTATFAPTLPTGYYAANDLIMVCMTNDSGSIIIGFGRQAVTVSNSGGDALFTYTGSDIWSDGDKVQLVASVYPGGFAAVTTYYVRDLSTAANTYKLATSSGGAAIAYSSAGTSVYANLMTGGANYGTATGYATGWEVVVGQITGGSGGNTNQQAWAFKVAASSSETAPTFSGTGDQWMADSFVVKDAPTSSVTDGATCTSWDSAGTAVSGSLTTTAADCLLLYSFSSDTANVMRTTSPSATNGMVALNWRYAASTEVTQILGFRLQDSAAAVPTVDMYAATTTEGGNAWVLAIKNKTGGARQPFVQSGFTEHKWYGYVGPQHSATIWDVPSAFCGGISIDSLPFHTATAASSAGTNWVSWSKLNTNNSTTGSWSGGSHTFGAAINLTGKIVSFEWMVDFGYGNSGVGEKGLLLCFGDSSNNWAAYRITVGDVTGHFSYLVENTSHLAIGSSAPYATGGAIDWTDVTQVAYVIHRNGSTASDRGLFVANLYSHGACVLIGGGENYPHGTKRLGALLNTYGQRAVINGQVFLQGSAQTLGKFPIQIGDGSIKTYFDETASSYTTPITHEFSRVSQNKYASLPTGTAGVTIKTSANDTINYTAAQLTHTLTQPLTIDAASNTSAPLSFAGTSFVRNTVTCKTGFTYANTTFSECPSINGKGATFTDVIIKKTTANSSSAAINFDASSAVVTRATIDVTGTSAGYHIELGASNTAITLTDVTFTGTPATDKVHVLATTGTVTITISGTTTLVAGDVTSAGATVVISSPSIDITFSGLIAGSQLKCFTAGTQTELFSDTNTATSEIWSSATGPFDFTLLKDGYVPIRYTSEAATASRTITVQQVIDRAYSTPSGLTFGTNLFYAPATKLAGLTVTSTLQNLYSQFIQSFRTEATLQNKAFPLSANGPNSFSWLDGNTFDLTTYSASITNLSRDGMRYLNTSGNATAMWAAIWSSGVPAGEQVRYQQSDAGTTVNANGTGNIDELVQILSDPNGDGVYADGYDRRGYMVLKCQADGYDQAEVNAVTLYGNLEDQLYVVSLTPTSNGLAAGNPSLATAPTISQGTYVEDGKTFSVKIVDGATANTGTMIQRWLRYNFELGGAFQSEDAFNWHDLVRVNGNEFKTVNGVVYGTATTKGVLVYMNDGTTLHPDFNLFTADNGTTYAIPVIADVSITGMPTATGASTRLQIINHTALSASAWTANTVYADGALCKRTTGIGSENTAGLYMRCTTAGTSHATTEPTWNTTVGGTTADGTVTWTCYAVLFYDADPVASSYVTTYTDGNQFLAGETVKIRFAEMDAGTSFKRYDITLVAATTGFSTVVDEVADEVYATNGLNGSSYEGTYSPNFTLDYIVLDTNTDYSGVSAYAYFCYILTTSNGMYEFWGGVTAIDVGNYRIESDILNLFFDETNGFVKPTDTSRIFRKDGTRPALDPTTGGHGLEINWRVPVSVVSVAGASVITGDIADVPTAAENAEAVATHSDTLTLGKFIALK